MGIYFDYYYVRLIYRLVEFLLMSFFVIKELLQVPNNWTLLFLCFDTLKMFIIAIFLNMW